MLKSVKLMRKGSFLGIILGLLMLIYAMNIGNASYQEISTSPLVMEQASFDVTVGDWQEVILEKSYSSPIVVCTPHYSKNSPPINLRVRNVGPTSFECKVIMAEQGAQSPDSIKVSYFAIEEGRYSLEKHGIKCEAFKLESTFVNGKNSLNKGKGTKVSKSHEYVKPLVFGGIQTAYDETFQFFWSCGSSIFENPSNSNIYVGRHVGELAVNNLPTETLGVVIIEEGDYFIGEAIAHVKMTPKTIGALVSGGTSLAHGQSYVTGAVACQTGMRGGDGSFAVFNGDNAVKEITYELATDEDTFGDTERYHTDEQFNTIIFTSGLPAPVLSHDGTHVSLEPISVSMSHVNPFATITYTTDGSEPQANSNVYTQELIITDTVELKIKAFLNGYVASPTVTSKLYVISNSLEGVTLAPGWIKTRYFWPYGSDGVQRHLEYMPDPSTFIVDSVGVSPSISGSLRAYDANTFEAYVYIPESGTYTYKIKQASNGVNQLYVDNSEFPLISKSASQSNAEEVSIYLEEGLHLFTVHYVSHVWTKGKGLLVKNESGDFVDINPDFIYHSLEAKEAAKSKIDSDQDGLSDAYEKTVSSSHKSYDTDKDGISDYDELMVYGTNPKKADSDGDGLSDFVEHVVFQGMEESQLGDILVEQAISVTDYSASKGQWEADGIALKARSFRGEVTYDVQTASDDMYLLKLRGGSTQMNSTKTFDVQLFVDGIYIDRLELQNTSNHQNSNYAMRFKGSLNVETADTYKFYLNSKNGSLLYVDGELVVNNDGLHGVIEENGSIELSEGLHTIEVQYFHTKGSSKLEVSYESSSIIKQALPDSALTSVRWDYYEGAYKSMPNFDYLSAVKTGEGSNFDIGYRKNIASGAASVMLPWMTSGEHKIVLLWDNMKYNSTLKIEALDLLTIDGVDSDLNGKKDWVDQKLASDCSLDSVVSSQISPVSIEGRGRFTELISVSGTQAYPANDNRWYSRIDLNAYHNTTVSVSFQNGAKVESRNITWERTNIFDVNETIILSKGDSLLLDPAFNGEEVSLEIVIGGETYPVTSGEAIPYTFSEAGDIEIVANAYLPNNGFEAKTIVVKVVDIALPTDKQVGLVTHDRVMSLTNTDGIVYEADQRLNAFYFTGQSEELVVCLDEIEERVAVARLGKNGPIVGHVVFQGMDATGLSDTYYITADSLPDGSSIVEMGITAYPIMPSVQLQIDVYLAGVTLDDGTRERYLGPEVFSDIHETEIIILKTAKAPKTAACHHLNVYQNGQYVGRAY